MEGGGEGGDGGGGGLGGDGGGSGGGEGCMQVTVRLTRRILLFTCCITSLGMALANAGGWDSRDLPVHARTDVEILCPRGPPLPQIPGHV